MSERDIIDEIQEREEDKGTIVETISDICGFGGMFLCYMGLFKLFVADELMRWQGLVTGAFGLAVMLLGTYGPVIMAALHARDKKYLIAYVFFGSRMVRRDIELVDDPLVVAKMTEDDEIEFLEPLDESDYEVAIRAVGADFLNDRQINKKIDDALRKRIDKIREVREKKAKKHENMWGNPYKDKGEDE